MFVLVESRKEMRMKFRDWKFFLAGVVLSSLVIPAIVNARQELVSLTTPVTYINTSQYHLSSLLLDVDNLQITATLVAPSPAAPIIKSYTSRTNPTGATLLHSLNTSNFTVNSLIKTVYNRLITDSVITGTVSGTPQH